MTISTKSGWVLSAHCPIPSALSLSSTHDSYAEGTPQSIKQDIILASPAFYGQGPDDRGDLASLSASRLQKQVYCDPHFFLPPLP